MIVSFPDDAASTICRSTDRLILALSDCRAAASVSTSHRAHG